MYRRVADFLEAWKQESEGTTRILRGLDDRSLSASGSDAHRSLGRLAWHLTTTLGEMMERTGLVVAGPGPDSLVPANAAAIAASYETAAASIAKQVGAWTDATLEVEDEMYGERWARGKTLAALIAHQTHHRGQMTILMRQAGLPVPGIYGPSKEEWSAYGMTAPTI